MDVTVDTTPVLLSGAATVAITAGVPAAAVNFASAGLVNPLSDPIEVSDLIIVTTGLGTVRGSQIGFPTTEIMLKAGRHGMTNGFVPVVSIAPYRENRDVGPMPIDVGQPFVRRWIFPRPMILRPGEALSGAVRLSTAGIYTGITGTVETRLTLRGRRVPARSVPNVTPYPFSSGAFFAALNTPAQDLTFQNVFPVPLTVVSVIGMLAGMNTNAPNGALQGNVRIIGPGGDAGGVRRAVVDNSNGSVTFGDRRSIEVPHVLLPNESLRVTFTSAAVSGGPDAPTPAVSLMGSREEAA